MELESKAIVMKMPKDVSYIIHRLEELGYEAYAVGGCVRDTILGREPMDWDITTSAKPLEVKAAFSKTIDTGLQHGTVTVMMHHVGYEVTTYRIDGEYEDNRHPKQVEYTDDILLDLQRRDFTINAMAYNDSRGLVDAFDGLGDLKRGIIRCVGDAGKRFDEDALRMLRAVRFSGQLGFSIEEKTKQAIIERVERLSYISAERIRVELSKLLVSKDAGQIREVVHTGMAAIFLPELVEMMGQEQNNPHHCYTVGEHCVRSVEIMNRFFGKKYGDWDAQYITSAVDTLAYELVKQISEKEKIMLCLAMLLHDVGKPACASVDEKGTHHFYGHPAKGAEMAAGILRRLTFDNDTVAAVKHLIYFHDYKIEPNPVAVRRAVSKIQTAYMPMFFLVQLSDVLAQNPDLLAPKLERIFAVKQIYDQILQQQCALSIKDLAVNGKDLIAVGIMPGPKIGQVLSFLLEQVLQEPQRNTKETLLTLAREQISDLPTI